MKTREKLMSSLNVGGTTVGGADSLLIAGQLVGVPQHLMTAHNVERTSI